MFALIDGNNFYASCERVFQPELRNRPLIVLSNNDGCAIARSEEAKKLGVAMGQPLHLIPKPIRQQLAVRSANFSLYGDMSRRVLEILQASVRHVEAYSIDESFLDLSGVSERPAFAYHLHQRVHRWTGIPNCIGIGQTKTLAKLANHIAKQARRKPGSYPVELAEVCDLSDFSAPHQLHALLQLTDVCDVWGVGRRWARRLHTAGIQTAADLYEAPTHWIRAEFGVVLARTQRELHGISCLALEEHQPDRQQIVVSRSFGQCVRDPDALLEALTSFTSSAAEKLRVRGLRAKEIHIFAYPDPFNPAPPPRQTHCGTELVLPTDDTRQLLGALRPLVDALFCEGTAYKKAGVALSNLARQTVVQEDLFAPKTKSKPQVMATMDAINQRFGKGTMGVATAIRPLHKDYWQARRSHMSQRFTTCLDELPVVQSG